MVSLSKKTVSSLTRIGIISLVVYTVGFLFFKVGAYYKTYYEKDRLTQELQIKKNETNRITMQIEVNKKRIENLQNSYMTKEEIDLKIKDIFERMSIFDYKLKFLDSKKMCIDRYVLVTQLTADSENGIKAGEGILSYIGKVQKSEKNDSLYFVNYITIPKENR